MVEESAILRSEMEGLKREMEDSKAELEKVKHDRDTFQSLACEKDIKISKIRMENETFKVQSRGEHSPLDNFSLCQFGRTESGNDNL